MPFDPERVSQALLDHCEDSIAKGIAPVLARNEELARAVVDLEEQLAGLALTLAAVVAEAAVAVPLVELAAPEPRDWTPEIEALRAAIPAHVEPPDLSGFATKYDLELVRQAIPVLPEPPDLSGLASKAELEEVRASIPDYDFAGVLDFATKAEVEAVYSAIPDLPDLSGFAIKAELEDVRAAIPAVPDLSGFASKEDLEAVRMAIPARPEPPDLSGFATKAELEAIELTPGPVGLMPEVIEWTDRVHYEGECCTYLGSTFQARRDTGQPPPHGDWLCIAKGGEDGDGLQFLGTHQDGGNYFKHDVVMLNGSSFVALCKDPGPCPGDGWQLMSSAGSKGKPGEGRTGPAGAGIIDVYLDERKVCFVGSDGSNYSITLPSGVDA